MEGSGWSGSDALMHGTVEQVDGLMSGVDETPARATRW